MVCVLEPNKPGSLQRNNQVPFVTVFGYIWDFFHELGPNYDCNIHFD